MVETVCAGVVETLDRSSDLESLRSTNGASKP